MNKQELIDKLNKQLTTPSKGTDFDYGHDYGIQRAIYLAEDLDEQQAPINKPEKPVVPQYVADWLEVCKDNLPLSLAHSMNNIIMMSNNQPDKTIHWIAKNSETFAKAWLYGYEIEKEKLYRVELPNPNGDSNRYGLCKVDGRIIIGSFVFGLNKAINTKLTESEIKEDFEWAWQFAEEVKE